MKNHKGFVPALLTLGLVLIGSLVTIGVSYLTNTNKIASNPKAAETCTTGFYALEGEEGVSGSGCKAVCGSDCEKCNWAGKTKWQCKSVAGGNVHACTEARTYASLTNCVSEHKEDGKDKCTQCLLGQTNRVEYGGSGPPAGGSEKDKNACEEAGGSCSFYAKCSYGTYGGKANKYCSDINENDECCKPKGSGGNGGSMTNNLCTKASTSNSTNTCVKKTGTASNDSFCRSSGYNGGWSNWTCIEGDPTVVCCSKLEIGGSGDGGGDGCSLFYKDFDCPTGGLKYDVYRSNSKECKDVIPDTKGINENCWGTDINNCSSTFALVGTAECSAGGGEGGTDSCIGHFNYGCGSFPQYSGSTKTFDYFVSTADECKTDTIRGYCFGTSSTSCSDDFDTLLKSQCGETPPAEPPPANGGGDEVPLCDPMDMNLNLECVPATTETCPLSNYPSYTYLCMGSNTLGCCIPVPPLADGVGGDNLRTCAEGSFQSCIFGEGEMSGPAFCGPNKIENNVNGCNTVPSNIDCSQYIGAKNSQNYYICQALIGLNKCGSFDEKKLACQPITTSLNSQGVFEFDSTSTLQKISNDCNLISSPEGGTCI